ncbi:TPA: hypothetical protein NJ338_003236 [Vibrio parahaemolyticus]|nr:hypothetical protein [Vibrio parahaemolyticus]
MSINTLPKIPVEWVGSKRGLCEQIMGRASRLFYFFFFISFLFLVPLLEKIDTSDALSFLISAISTVFIMLLLSTLVGIAMLLPSMLAILRHKQVKNIIVAQLLGMFIAPLILFELRGKGETIDYLSICVMFSLLLGWGMLYAAALKVENVHPVSFVSFGGAIKELLQLFDDHALNLLSLHRLIGFSLFSLFAVIPLLFAVRYLDESNLEPTWSNFLQYILVALTFIGVGYSFSFETSRQPLSAVRERCRWNPERKRLTIPYYSDLRGKDLCSLKGWDWLTSEIQELVLLGRGLIKHEKGLLHPREDIFWLVGLKQMKLETLVIEESLFFSTLKGDMGVRHRNLTEDYPTKFSTIKCIKVVKIWLKTNETSGGFSESVYVEQIERLLRIFPNLEEFHYPEIEAGGLLRLSIVNGVLAPTATCDRDEIVDEPSYLAHNNFDPVMDGKESS